MNREQYLTKLKNLLPALTEEERNEALQYYSDYFDEAGDDEKVIAELGSVEEVAQSIIDKFAGVPATTKKSSESEDNNDDFENIYTRADDALCFDFENKDIRALDMKLGGCMAVFVKGKQWMVESRGLLSDEIECRVKNDGTLVLNNVNGVKRFHFFGFFNHDRKTRHVPRILITIPENASVRKVNLKIGAGNFLFKDAELAADEMFCNIGAGNLSMTGTKINNLKMTCGMGNITFAGSIGKNLILDCGMGNIKMDLKGNEDDYSFDCKVGLGDFRFGDKTYSGVQTIMANYKKDKHVSANAGMGSIRINFN